MTGCETVRAELPAYIAGELDHESTGLVERHVADCRDCARELDDLRAVVDVLVRSPVPHEPPPDLEEHVFALVELEPVAALVASAPIKHEPPVDLERRSLQHAGIFEIHGNARWPRLRAALVPGLAVMTVVFGVLGFNWRDESAERGAQIDAWKHRYGSWGSTMQTFNLAATGEIDRAATAEAEIVQSPHENYTLVLRIRNLEAVPPGYHYEVWLAGSRGWVPGGSFSVQGPAEVVRSFPIGVDPRDFPQIEITLEPDSGDPAVTGPTIMEAQLELSG